MTIDPMYVPACPSGVRMPNPWEEEAPPCPNCGDETAAETLPETRRLRWGCCGYTEAIDPYDDPSL